MFEKVKINPVNWAQQKLFGSMLNKAWEEGYAMGAGAAERSMAAKIKSEFIKNGLEDFKSEELKIGYVYAKGLVTDVLDGKR